MTLRGQGQREFTKFTQDVRLGLQRTLLEEAPRMEEALRYTLSPEWGPRTGRTYRRGGRSDLAGGRIHRASAPGEPPARDTGELQDSVATDQSNVRGRRVKYVQVGVTAKHGAFLEEGTPKMDPRPFLERSASSLNGMLERYGRKIGF